MWMLVAVCSTASAFGQSLLVDASTRRVDVIMIGDSNQLFGGHGLEEAYAILLEERYGLYSTGVHWLGENAGNGAGVGLDCTTLNTAGAGVFSYQQPGTFADPLNPAGFDFSPAGAISLQSNSFSSVGIALSSNSRYFNVGDLLEFRGLFQTWGSTAAIRPQVRLGVPPYSVWAQTNPIAHTPGVREFVLQHVMATSSAAEFRLGGTLTGPWTAYFASICNVNRLAGGSVNTFYGNGGRSARDFAETLATADPSILSRFLSHIHAKQNSVPGGPRVLVRIAFGLNDINEQLPSIITQIASSSPQGFAENLHFIKDRIESAWNSLGWNADNLQFVISTPHPIGDPNDSRLAAFPSAVEDRFTDANTVKIHLSQLTTFQSMVSSGWFVSSTDRYHLTRNGYRGLAEFEFDQLLSNLCPADMNEDRAVDGEDLIAFFGFWDIALPQGDFNGDTYIDGDDLIAFFASWDSGC
jgi:hypothetical protein